MGPHPLPDPASPPAYIQISGESGMSFLRLFGSYDYTDQGAFPSEHAARKVSHDPQLRKESG
jgi:hypothetical protein